MSLNELLINLNLVIHLTFLVLWTCVLVIVDLFIPKNKKSITALLAAVGLLITLILVVIRSGTSVSAFNGMLTLDGFSTFLNVILLISGLVSIALAYDYLKRSKLERGEYYTLLLFSIFGMMLMVSASNLIMVFLALELLSIPLYVLAGIAVPQVESEEASLKYFLLGAFASAFFLYGTALVYGSTGSTALSEIVSAIPAESTQLSTLLIGAALILVGLGFKVAVVPFHMWTPDVYHGAPSSVTAFMSIGAKVAGFAALLRIFVLAFPALADDMTTILWTLAAVTLVLGNVIAISQKNIKRMLAYSSIAHAGFILMALVPYGNEAVSSDSVAAALFYLMAYMLTNFAAWAVVIALERRNPAGTSSEGLTLDDYAGLGRQQPALALTMSIAMLSFLGLPPTLGFVAKFFVLRTVLEGGYPGLALIGVLTSLVSAYYYLRVIGNMYMRDGEPIVRREVLLFSTAVLTAACTCLLYTSPSPRDGLLSRMPSSA